VNAKKYIPERDCDPRISKAFLNKCQLSYQDLALESVISISKIKKAARNKESYPLSKKDYQLLVEAAERLKKGVRGPIDETQFINEQNFYNNIVMNFKSMTYEQKRVLSELSLFIKAIIPNDKY
jgi:hypothetical protein